MRFKTELKNVKTFSKLAAALGSLEKIAWMRLDDEHVRFTVIPDKGSQVWASLSMDHIFESYNIQSNDDKNTINLELPLQPLQRALRSALGSTHATLRLTKKDNAPVLSMVITTTSTSNVPAGRRGGGRAADNNNLDDNDLFGTRGGGGGGGGDDDVFAPEALEQELSAARERDKVITQDIPVRVLHPDSVEAIMQPKVREPDVHIQLPPLLQLKAISDRFTKLALTAAATGGARSGAVGAVAGAGPGPGLPPPAAGFDAKSPKLELSANMHGSLRLRLGSDTLDICSVWAGLENPELDPGQLAVPIEEHPSTVFREAGPDKWATVRVDGRDWSKVLSVGRLEGRVIACFADDNALILYVYVPQYDDTTAEDSVVTYYVTSYSL